MASGQLAPSKIAPLTYQSQDVSFAQWITLLTLALAPLIAHIVAGVPRPSYLSRSRPRWHESLPHYNPTSILWRYAAITDRRIRSNAWDRAVMAPTNALFWTARGWDGSEEMVTTSLPYCTHLPEHSRISLFSSEMIKSLIVTLQGLQAVYVLASGLAGSAISDDFVLNMAVDKIFYPIAFVGLLRLCCGPWLTEEFTYTTRTIGHELSNIRMHQEDDSRSSVDSLLNESTYPCSTGKFRSTSYWASRCFRVFYLLITLGLWVICAMYLIPGIKGGMRFTITSLLVALFYLVLLMGTNIICAYYLVRGHTTTVIPCAGSTWYKAYTVFVQVFAVALIVIACMETRRSPCGNYTSETGGDGDTFSCYSRSVTSVVRLNLGDSSNFGYTTTYPRQDDKNNSLLGEGEYWVYNFTGHCLGNVDFSLAQRAKTVGVTNITEIGSWDPGY